ncbi:MAG: hypothetical protein IJ467_01700 [Bacteroidaceae bacterium]|nr:hypothetical protein [Bacteroidaceae bacterium]
MKKNLLFVAALAAGMCANAQSYVQVDPEGLGLSGDAVALTAGTLIGENDDIKLSIAFDDSYKSTSVAANDYTTIVFDATELDASKGAQGSNNPKTADGSNPATLTPPQPATGGAVLQIDAKADGYVYVYGKLSTNKNYTVFEEGTAIGYRLAMQDNTFNLLDITVAGEGEFNYVQNPIPWPEVIFTGDEASAVKGSGLGVIKFPVFKDLKYLVNACGSKISFGGAYFDKEGDVQVSIKGEVPGEKVLLTADGSSNIASNVAEAEVVASQYYTVAGQAISAPAKGINLVKQTLADGTVKVVKVIVK